MKQFTLRNQQNFDQNQSVASPRRTHKRAFTLVEILVVMAIIGVLAALGFAMFGGGRARARQAQCDVNVKALAIALDAFKQEKGRYPAQLSELVTGKFINELTLMRCPDDPDAQSVGYDIGYVRRSVRNDPRFGDKLPPLSEMPTILCPFHEGSQRGVQGFVGMHTHQFATRPAVLVSANAVSVLRAGTKTSIPANSGMELRGGDRIQTQTDGVAEIKFADGSIAQLRGKGDVTLLQSFLTGSQSTLYTLLRHTLGDVSYTVTRGSKFDVSTPTATAGALGTEFNIVVSGSAGSSTYDEKWINTSTSESSKVYCSLPNKVIIIKYKEWEDIDSINSVQPQPTATPEPTSTPNPTATPRSKDKDDDDDDDNGGGNNGR